MRDLSGFLKQHNTAYKATHVITAGPLFLDLNFTGLKAFPSLGHEIWSDSLEWGPGGVANQAIACVRLGMSVEICSFIGNDFLGNICKHALETMGVDMKYSQQREHQNLTVALPYQGERALISHGMPCTPPLPPLTRPPDFLSIGLADVAANSKQIKSWRERGTKVIADVGWQDIENPDLINTINEVDIFVPNSEEACALTGLNNVSLAANKLASLGTDIIVTQGKDGAYVHSRNNQRYDLPAPNVCVKDTTGAGDTFTAGLIWALSAELNLEDAATIAIYVASLQTTRAGSALAAPTLGELKDFYQTINH